ncbi:MAG TPA: ABC transporter permease [Candidatus Pacearchaeota archaeon]|nr:ABC transporter permease [Candidatus Pacearchaeota archaeon]HQG09214.1 ABC transporter permease [Candidatus Pacearchaeota archaeon]HQH20135.1 ABC transporter permease [Candidatus Pacearchaeota archaeon]HQK58443.1 ABC transporter permease [Candidatus Pacearchaeota archaeon]
MNLVESITSAYKTLVHNKVRSFLTMLGIVIGIMSVIVVMSLGDSAKGLILNEVKTLGSNLIIIMPGKTNPKGPPSTLFGNVVTTLKYKDATQILKADNPHIESVCAYVQGTDVLSWSDNNPILTFKGVMSTYIEAEGAKLQAGRFFTEEEDNYNARVIVLGSKAAKDIFGEQNPLGEKVKIRKVNFTVIGVLAERGGGLAQTQDKEVFIPLKTAQNLLLGIDYVSSIRVKVDKSENINDTIMYIEDVLRRSHNIHNPDDDDFTVRSSETAIEAIAQITSAVQFFLVAIASISLLVGGFGIMNIMLATVQERTREIGLRKAVGAKNSDITLQFLIETSFITLVAGVIGIILGALISWLVAVVAQFFGLQWDFIVSPFSIFLGCFVSVGVGLIFGIAPARRASLLNPIEALHYE